MKTRNLKTIIVLALFFLLPFLSSAQEMPPSEALSLDKPIGSWLLLIIGAGALYGVFKMWSGNNQQSIK